MRHVPIFLVSLLAITAFPVSTVIGKEGKRMGELRISSPAFQHNGYIPSKFTCDGSDVNPPLLIENVPSTARSLALVVDDPDAPMGVWVHWVVWNIAPKTGEIGENAVPAGGVQGKNDWRRNNYGGPCPPSGTHSYFFKLYALGTLLNLGSATTKADLERAMQGHVLAKGELVGLYKRK